MRDSVPVRTLATLLKKPFVVHPLLFALFPVLFLYAHNISLVSSSHVWRVMMVVVLGALVLWVLLAIMLRDRLKAGLATTIFVILFFSYGRLYDFLSAWHLPMFKHAYLLPATLLFWGYCVYFIKTARADFRSVTRILNGVGLVLVVLNLGIIAYCEIGQSRMSSSDRAAFGDAALNGTSEHSLPDIYYIILDEYAHPDTMLEYYDYDNGDFINMLEDRGFFVALNSRVAYSETAKSIASSLEMEHLSASEPFEFYAQRITESTVASQLRTLGYRYIHFGSWYEFGEISADVYYNFYYSGDASAVVSQFSRTLWNTTMVRPFHDHLAGSIYAGHYRSAIIDTFECLRTIPGIEGPTFSVAHVLCPHAPFVFGPEGECVDPAEWANIEDKRFYLGQYQFISKEILGLVGDLLDRSDAEPIIILQSDHGLRHGASGHPDIGKDEWRKILNAYYLPGDGLECVYNSISPVNSFRAIFNHYFGGHYELLDD